MIPQEHDSVIKEESNLPKTPAKNSKPSAAHYITSKGRETRLTQPAEQFISAMEVSVPTPIARTPTNPATYGAEEILPSPLQEFHNAWEDIKRRFPGEMDEELAKESRRAEKKLRKKEKRIAKDKAEAELKLKLTQEKREKRIAAEREQEEKERRTEAKKQRKAAKAEKRKRRKDLESEALVSQETLKVMEMIAKTMRLKKKMSKREEKQRPTEAKEWPEPWPENEGSGSLRDPFVLSDSEE